MADPDKCDPYLVNASIDPAKTYINVICNSPGMGGNGGGSGRALCYALMYGDVEGRRTVLHHEFTGHGIGKLWDEYISYPGTTVSTQFRDQITNGHRYGYYLNLSITSDPAQVPWAHFIGHQNYPYVGVHEGAYYEYGVWRSEPKSIMMSAGNEYFNAVSREQIVKNILSIAGETYLFDEFVRRDVNENVD